MWLRVSDAPRKPDGYLIFSANDARSGLRLPFQDVASSTLRMVSARSLITIGLRMKA